MTTTDAASAYNDVLADAGNSKGLNCNGTWFARRDAIDQRIVNDVKNGTGRIIDNPSEVGGWLTTAAGTPCADSDHDGMADDWENMYGFNPNSASDGPQDADSDGYTNLEEFLNGTNPTGGAPVNTPTPTPTQGPGATATPASCPADVNNDNFVNITDIITVLEAWGSCSGCIEDLNGDNTVNIADVIAVLQAWGKC